MPMIGVSKLRHVVDGVIAFTALTGHSMMELTLAAVLYCVCMLIAVKRIILSSDLCMFDVMTSQTV